MHRFGHCFRHLLEDQMCFATHYTFRIPSVGGATRFANLWWKYSKMQKNRPKSCAIYFVELQSIYIVINYNHVYYIAACA